MRIRVLFTLNMSRKTPVMSGYRADWCSDNKPEYNCAQLSFSDKEAINPGEQYECVLQPLRPELWNKVIVGDILKCMEGSKQVGEALVLEITIENRRYIELYD